MAFLIKKKKKEKKTILLVPKSGSFAFDEIKKNRDMIGKANSSFLLLGY